LTIRLKLDTIQRVIIMQERGGKMQGKKCSFCGQPIEVVKKLIQGGKLPIKTICTDCVALCNHVIAEETKSGIVKVVLVNEKHVVLMLSDELKVILSFDDNLEGFLKMWRFLCNNILASDDDDIEPKCMFCGKSDVKLFGIEMTLICIECVRQGLKLVDSKDKGLPFMNVRMISDEEAVFRYGNDELTVIKQEASSAWSQIWQFWRKHFVSIEKRVQNRKKL